jgi:hypothetical protein
LAGAIAHAARRSRFSLFEIALHSSCSGSRKPYTEGVHRSTALPLILILWANLACGQAAPGGGEGAPTPAGQALVDRALANELNGAQNHSHLMRYQLRKTTPRLTTTKEILETKDGDVARLIAVNDEPLSPAAEASEEARLNALLADPGKQRRRKQAEDEDAARAFKVLRAMPAAFLYDDGGSASGPTGKVEKFAFRPNPAFNPPDLETEVLTALTGEIWIDPVQLRVVRLAGRLEQDVNFGWGILGRLNKGGWIAIDQAPVGPGTAPSMSMDPWRIVRFQMQMRGRVVFKNRVFDTAEEESHFASLPAGLTYRQGIAMLRDKR